MSRDLDALVAEKIMGVRILTAEEMAAEAERVWKVQRACRFFHMGFEAHPSGHGPVCEQTFKPYSTDIRAATAVMDELIRRGIWLWWTITHSYEGTAVKLHPHPCEGLEDVTVAVDPRDADPDIPHTDSRVLARAICLAALKAVGESG